MRIETWHLGRRRLHIRWPGILTGRVWGQRVIASRLDGILFHVAVAWLFSWLVDAIVIVSSSGGSFVVYFFLSWLRFLF